MDLIQQQLECHGKIIEEVMMLDRITKDIKSLFGKNLISIVLFGSCAAGRQEDTIYLWLLITCLHREKKEVK